MVIFTTNLICFSTADLLIFKDDYDIISINLNKRHTFETMSVKIIDKINAIYAAEAEAEKNGTAPEKKNTYYSYEYFPPKTAAGKFRTYHFN